VRGKMFVEKGGEFRPERLDIGVKRQLHGTPGALANVESLLYSSE
jgi:hypothetical protein